jgi:hypothetical protein
MAEMEYPAHRAAGVASAAEAWVVPEAGGAVPGADSADAK